MTTGIGLLMTILIFNFNIPRVCDLSSRIKLNENMIYRCPWTSAMNSNINSTFTGGRQFRHTTQANDDLSSHQRGPKGTNVSFFLRTNKFDSPRSSMDVLFMWTLQESRELSDT